MAEKTLIVITGPTGSGKTDTAIDLALKLNAEIISADSRQIYRGIPIGTAAPTKEQLDTVKHHFVGIFDLDQYYSAAQFEEGAINLLPSLFEKSDFAVMCGGSMMYMPFAKELTTFRLSATKSAKQHTTNGTKRAMTK